MARATQHEHGLSTNDRVWPSVKGPWYRFQTASPHTHTGYIGDEEQQLKPSWALFEVNVRMCASPTRCSQGCSKQVQELVTNTDTRGN